MKFFSFRVWASIAGSLVFFLAQPAAAEVYRWQDTRGRMYYSSVPPSTPVKNLEIKHDTHWLPYVADPVLRPQPNPALTTVVPYRKEQAVMTIPVILHRHLKGIFAVDTGASYTIISQAVADTLRLRPDPAHAPTTLRTANGDIQAPLVTLESLTIGNLTTYNIVAAIYDLPDAPTISGLLGLNLLDRFTLTVDAARQQMTFTPVKSALTEISRTALQEYDCVTGQTWMQQGARLNDGSNEEAWLYQQAIAACPDLLEAYYRLGHLYYRRQAYASAIDIHQRLLQFAPNEAEAYYRLGVLYMLDRQFGFAEEAFLQTLRLAPSHPQAQSYLQQIRHRE